MIYFYLFSINIDLDISGTRASAGILHIYTTTSTYTHIYIHIHTNIHIIIIMILYIILLTLLYRYGSTKYVKSTESVTVSGNENPNMFWILLPLLFLAECSSSTKQPHIIHVLVDDLGWAELGYHRNEDVGDVNTSFIDELVRTESLELDRFYTHKICSPSRCAIQTGRAPIHVNVQNVKPEVRNKKDPLGGYQGIPLNMTTVAEYMSNANYTTHFVGKYDVGMATPDHSPRARGYQTFMGYWHHANDYWTFDEETCDFKSVRDLWIQNDTYDGPAYALQNGASCSQSNQSPDSEVCVFEEEILGREVRKIISNHDLSSNNPLFLFWSMHLVHMPLQVPNEYLSRFSQIEDSYRQKMHAMTNYVDDEMRDVVTLLKQRGMWNDTLLVFHSDNGGEIMVHVFSLSLSFFFPLSLSNPQLTHTHTGCWNLWRKQLSIERWKV